MVGNMPATKNSRNRDERPRLFWRIVLSVLALYLFGLLLYALSLGDMLRSARLFAISTTISAAIALTGGLLGFLFGIPRSFRQSNFDDFSEPVSNTELGGDGLAASSRSQALDTKPSRAQSAPASWMNDNLVEISDWLTKIVVGVGLVQLHQISEWLGRNGELIGKALVQEEWSLRSTAATQEAGHVISTDAVAGVSIILLSFSIGFLVSYVYSRTIITSMFAQAFVETDQLLSGKIRQDIKEIRNIQEKQMESVSQTTDALLSIFGEKELPRQVLAHLYRPKPDGFQRAIEIGEALVREGIDDASSKIWRYLAAAYGQQYGYEKSRGASAQSLKKIADKAFHAVSKAIELDPAEKRKLRGFWDVNDPLFNGRDDDLTPLYNDASERDRFYRLFE